MEGNFCVSGNSWLLSVLLEEFMIPGYLSDVHK